MKTTLAMLALSLALVALPLAQAQPVPPPPPIFRLPCYDTTYAGPIVWDVIQCAEHLLNGGHGPQGGFECNGDAYFGPLVDDIVACVHQLTGH